MAGVFLFLYNNNLNLFNSMKVIIPQDLNEITLKQMIKLADIEKLEIDEVEKAKEVIKLLA